MTQPRRDWTLARAKVDGEGVCRVCRTSHRVEAAHITGRTHDREDGLEYLALTAGGKLLINPDRIVPLCGPATDLNTCHGKYDAHRLDLLPHLHLEEVLQAVADSASGRSNGFETARQRMVGNEMASAA